jgi:hypothetical protein
MDSVEEEPNATESLSRSRGAGASIFGTAGDNAHLRAFRTAGLGLISGREADTFFCISVLRSSEPSQARVFVRSATSCRITTSFGSWALRNTLPFVIPAEERCISLRVSFGP